MPKKTIAGLLGEEIEAIQPTVVKQKKPSVLTGSPSTIQLSDIKPRALNTRPIDKDHGRALMESIRVLGLIEPIVTDTDGVLLAGGHRHWALKTMIVEHPDDFNKQFPGAEIPVHRLDFKAEEDESLALAVEIGENEHRRNYSANEIKEVVSRLEKAGYKRIKGRAAKDDKPLMPVLSAAVGLSKRRINAILRKAETEEAESGKDGSLSKTKQRDRHLKTAISALEKWKAIDGRGREPRESELAKEIDEMLERLGEALVP